MEVFVLVMVNHQLWRTSVVAFWQLERIIVTTIRIVSHESPGNIWIDLENRLCVAIEESDGYIEQQ